jgi:hypothetical protein
MKPAKPQALIYIDECNWYHAVFKHHPEWKWLNVQTFFEALRPDDKIVRVKLFSAMVNPDGSSNCRLLRLSLENDMQFLEAVSKCLNCPAHRVNLIEDSSTFDLSTVRNGVVIFFATWSAPAHVALKAYTAKLSDLRQDIPVWILNVDTLTAEVDEKFRAAKHGYGETLFFQRGVQVDELLFSNGNFGENFRLKWKRTFDN